MHSNHRLIAAVARAEQPLGAFRAQHISMMMEGGGARISLAAGARGRVRRLVWQQPIQQPIYRIIASSRAHPTSVDADRRHVLASQGFEAELASSAHGALGKVRVEGQFGGSEERARSARALSMRSRCATMTGEHTGSGIFASRVVFLS